MSGCYVLSWRRDGALHAIDVDDEQTAARLAALLAETGRREVQVHRAAGPELEAARQTLIRETVLRHARGEREDRMLRLRLRVDELEGETRLLRAMVARRAAPLAEAAR